jgi:uncharacterized short protein YbdD (DUF466 family)
MWAAGKSIATIAQTLGRIDKHNPNDPYHSLRNFMYQLRKRRYRGRKWANCETALPCG